MTPIANACASPGCPELVESGYCAEHRRSEDPNVRRAGPRARGYDYRWDRVSRLYRRRRPLCEMCAAEGVTTPVDLVHHIVPPEKGGPMYAFSNLMSVCTTHHAQIHAEAGTRGDGLSNP